MRASIVPERLVQENVLAVQAEVLHRPGVAVVRERERIDLGVAVAVQEPGRLVGLDEPGADAADDEHQVALLRREDHLVPVDEPELPGIVDQHVPGVEVGVAEDGRQRRAARPAGRGPPFGRRGRGSPRGGRPRRPRPRRRHRRPGDRPRRRGRRDAPGRAPPACTSPGAAGAESSVGRTVSWSSADLAAELDPVPLEQAGLDARATVHEGVDRDGQAARLHGVRAAGRADRSDDVPEAAV